MKKYISLFVLLGGFMVSSCSDFLERKPLDFGDQEVFLKTTADLKYYAYQFFLFSLLIRQMRMEVLTGMMKIVIIRQAFGLIQTSFLE